MTLVELIMVIAIIGILAAVSWESLGGAKQTSHYDNACQITAAMINKTRNYALTGKMVGSNVPGQFRINLSGTNINIYGDGSLIETVALSNGASFSGSYSVIFNVPNGDLASSWSPVSFSGGTKNVQMTGGSSAVCQ